MIYIEEMADEGNCGGPHGIWDRTAHELVRIANQNLHPAGRLSVVRSGGATVDCAAGTKKTSPASSS